MEATLTQKIDTIPHTPGVYQFKNSDGTVIYVGKAVDLKNRVRQYFQRTEAHGEKTALMVSHIRDIEIIPTASEFDALLLEAKLIHDLLPKYNMIARDDKSPLYILITFHEELPRILFVRKTQLAGRKPKDVIFGPFQSGRAVRQLVRQLRRATPYCTQKKRSGKPCFYTHLGLCAPCPSYVEKLQAGKDRAVLVRQIRANMFHLRDILSGQSKSVLSHMYSQMSAYADSGAFEKAQATLNHIRALEAVHAKHYDPEIYTQADAHIENHYEKELDSLTAALRPSYPALSGVVRIECIDISHTSGSDTTGSLVVLTGGNVDRSQYRRFKVRAESPNDVAAVSEVLKRRLAHTEWPQPDIFIIDGGKSQVRAAWDVLDGLGLTIPLLGLAKRFEEIVLFNGKTFSVLRLPYDSPALHLLQRIRDEAHRFALRYHRLLRKKSFTQG